MLPMIIGPLLTGLLGVVDKAVEDKDQAAVIKSRMSELALSGSLKELGISRKHYRRRSARR